MGAQGVLGAYVYLYPYSNAQITLVVARPIMYGLAISGQQGVEEVLRGLLADTEITLGLSGYKDIEDIQGKRDKVMVKWEHGTKL